ncbi:MAG: hypothetical protein ABWX90_01220, partial [Candidatus Saccharimonadales bacterium]
PFAQRILEQTSMREQWLFYANKSPSSGAFISQMAQALGERFVPTYSRVLQSNTHNTTPNYISYDLLERHLQDPHRYSYYLCGPSTMMAALVRELTAHGVDPQAIYSEEFSL